MAVTRINNNQISDAVAGNAFVGVNAAVKLQNYSITSQKIANNLTYGSDLTIAGNLTVQGNTTAIDTTYTTVEDPVILLASGQTGSPTVDIGFIGQRGISQNIAFVWDESASEFVTAFTTTGETNTTVSIASYTSFHTGNANIGGNMVVNGTSSFVGNVVGNVTFTGNVLLPSISTTGNITGGNLLTGGLISATGNITSAANVAGGNLLATTTVSAASHIGSVVSVTANVTGGNLLTGGLVSATGNITSAANVSGGNLVTSGAVSSTGNITGGNVLTGGLVSSTGNITSAANISGGNLLTGGAVSSTGNITGGNILTLGQVSTSGNVNSGNINTTNVSATNGLFTNNVTVAGTLTTTSNITANTSGIFFGNAVTGNGAIFAGVPGFTPLGSNIVIQISGNANSYSQVNFENINSGTLASTDFIVTADNGNDSVFFADFGIASSNHNDPAFFGDSGSLNDAYLYVVGNGVTSGSTSRGNLILGSTNGNIKMFVGNTAQSSVIQNISTGGVDITGRMSASGNVTGGNLLTGGLISATGNITSAANVAGGNVIATTTVSAPSHIGSVVSVTANITGGNVLTGGLISSTGNITSAANVAGGNLLATTTVSAASHIGSVVSVTANITGGNVLTGGLVSATGNITSAANVAGGNLLATTTVSAASHIGSVVSVTANITGGNVLTGGLVSATGNVTSAANVSGGNLVATTAVVTPTVIGTTVTVSSTGGLITLKPSTNVSVSSTYINNLADPVQNQDAATKIYVDNLVSTQIAYHDPVTAATTTTLEAATGGTITYNQPNGAGNGVGATLTVAGGTFNLIDTANIQTANTRVLIKNQANSVLNGVYIWSNATVLTRAVDADTYGPNSSTDFSINDYFFVQSGNVNAGSAWVVSAPSGTITFGTSNITFAQFSSSQTYTANTQAGISISGTVISAKVDNNTTAFDGSGNIIVKASANLTTPNIGAATGTSLSVTGNVSSAGVSVSGNVLGGNLLTGGVVSSTGNVSGGNILTSGIVSSTGNITSAANVAGGNVIATTIVSAPSHIGTIVSVTGNVTGGNVLTGGLISATANITGGNILTGGIISSTGNITSAANIAGGNLLATTTVSAASHIGSVVSVTANVTGGNLLTGGLVSATGNITSAANIAGGNLLATTTVSAASHIGSVVSVTANITGGNILTGGLVSSTGNITSAANIAGGNLLATTTVSAASHIGSVVSVTANVTGGNLLTGGLVSATGNITSAANIAGGNLLATTTVSAASHIGSVVSVTANITGGNLITGGVISATGNISTAGNITASYYFGNGSQLSGITATTSGFPVTAGTSNIAAATNGNIGVTVAGTSNVVTFASTGQFTTGLVSATGNISSSANISGGNVLATTVVSGASVLGSVVSASGNITGANVNTGGANGLTLNASNINSNAGRITINSADADVDFAVDGLSQGNVFYVDAGTKTASFGNSTQTTNAIVAMNATNSFLMPVGNTVQRPGVGVTGMLRFNSTLNAVEVYDNSSWATVGTPSFTVISDQQFNGDGANTVFTLSATATTNGVIVSINGVIQIPTLAYSVSGTTLTFTEAPQSGDVIDVRNITTTTSVTSISNSPGNAVVTANATSAIIEVTGTLSVSSNIVSSGSNGVANIGSATTYFNTVHAKATSAQYADLAENYTADAHYEPGTVVSFGGSEEVTVSSIRGDRKIAGVVSTNPSYVMNATLEGAHVVTIALTGRVPTKVSGPVAKGDMMVSGGNGRAIACTAPAMGTVIGKALQNHADGDGVIEVVVGRL